MNMKSKTNKVDPKSWIEFLDQYRNPGPQYLRSCVNLLIGRFCP